MQFLLQSVHGGLNPLMPKQVHAGLLKQFLAMSLGILDFNTDKFKFLIGCLIFVIESTHLPI